MPVSGGISHMRETSYMGLETSQIIVNISFSTLLAKISEVILTNLD